MNLPPGVTLAAAVLAGGRSSRMGRDKARLVWRGERLVDRQQRLVAALRPHQSFLSVRAGENYGRSGFEVVPDRAADRGPLGALETLFARMAATHLMVIAVDMPHLTVGLLEALCARCTPVAGVVPLLGGRLEPLAAVYPRSCAARLPDLRRAGCNAMRDLIAPSLAAGEMTLWPVPTEWEPAFANWNEPDDLPADVLCG